MVNPTIYVILTSIDTGTVPSVSSSVDVKEGGNLDINVTWPSSCTTNTITCDLNFSESGDQDPFNDVDGGDTSFSMTRSSSTEAAVNTITIQNNATIATDTYDLTLTINEVNYSTDPVIKVGGNH